MGLSLKSLTAWLNLENVCIFSEEDIHYYMELLLQAVIYSGKAKRTNTPFRVKSKQSSFVKKLFMYPPHFQGIIQGVLPHRWFTFSV